MAVTQQFQFEELDSASRDYLSNARERKGRGMPGIFVPRNDFTIGCLFLSGLAVLIAVTIISVNVIEEEPLGVAMLETAGVLLGGWLIVAAFRIWRASNGSKYAGHFVYADAETLWECSGAKVLTTDVHNVLEARGVQHFSNEGKYTHTAITVRLKDGTRNFDGKSEQRSQDLVVFLNMLAWMRSGGAATGPEGAQGSGTVDYSKLPAPIMGAVAKEIAEGGAMARDLTPESLGVDVLDVPMPRKEGRASSNVLNYAIILGLAVGGVFLFKSLNAGWRDDSIWDNINKFQLQDQRAPWLRAYLADSRNVHHRDEAREMLRKIYRDTVTRIRSGIVQVPQQPNGNFNLQPFQPAFPPQPAAAPRIDKDLVDGLAIVLMELAEQPTPIVTISARETGDAKGAKERAGEFSKIYSYGIKEGVGDELIVFVEAPPETKGMIDIVYDLKLVENRWQVAATISFRKSTDGDVEKTVKLSGILNSNTTGAMSLMAQEFGLKTAGGKKPVPQLN